MHPKAYSEPCHICENLQKFKTLTYLKPDTYSDLSQRFKIKFFVEIVKNYNYFSKALHLRSFTGFWISLSLNKYSLTWRVTSSYVLSDTHSDTFINSDIFRYICVLFRHIQPHCGIFRNLCDSCIFRNLPYSESWDI